MVNFLTLGMLSYELVSAFRWFSTDSIAMEFSMDFDISRKVILLLKATLKL